MTLLPAPHHRLAVPGLLLAVLLGGCEGAPRPEPAPPVQGAVDSTLPIAEEVRRFIGTVDSVPVALRGGAPSRDELVARFVRAVELGDTLAFPALLVQADEFIGLYYPHSRYTAPPYELSPSLLWFQMVNQSSRGIARLLQRDGGRPLGYRGMTCPGPPLEEGPNRIWDGCVVRLSEAGGAERERRLFGAILERDRTFKFLTFANAY